MEKTPMADKPILNFNNAAAIRIAQLIGTPGLLTVPDKLYLIGAFAEDHLTNLPYPPAKPADGASQTDFQNWERAYLDWGRTMAKPMETTIKRRDAIKDLVKSAIEKGAWSASIGERNIQKVLELGVEE